MGVNTAQLVEVVASELPSGALRDALAAVAVKLSGYGILERLAKVSSAITAVVADLDNPSFLAIAHHRSDAVRQWATYSVNDPRRSMSLRDRLKLTLSFAADPHMSVRECAWMAFRPFLMSHLEEGLELLTTTAQAADFRQRRFAVEVSRPRSVWGKHCEALKRRPEMARPLLEQLRREDARYVQLSVGNWINDASKTRPAWAEALCADWAREGNKGTDSMVKRGLRTLRSRTALHQQHAAQADLEQFSANNPGGG